MCIRTSLDATYHGSKDSLLLFLAEDLAFWFLVIFGKICTPILLNWFLEAVECRTVFSRTNTEQEQIWKG